MRRAGGSFSRSMAACSTRIIRRSAFISRRARSSFAPTPGAGPGNFHLKPNGVFYFSESEAGVMETGAFLKKKPKASFATQSGPMLVIDGKLHPRIARANVSAKARDGVCVRDGVVLFAITEGEAPFDTFERLFRDGLKCRNALFLDGGSAPALYAPPSKSGNSLLGLGPLIAVYEKGKR